MKQMKAGWVWRAWMVGPASGRTQQGTRGLHGLPNRHARRSGRASKSVESGTIVFGFQPWDQGLLQPGSSQQLDRGQCTALPILPLNPPQRPGARACRGRKLCSEITGFWMTR